MTSTLEVAVGHCSLKGPKRENEDFYGLMMPEGPLRTTKGIACAIADGMSGSDAGRQASDATVTGFLNDYFSTPESWTVRHSAHKVLSALNRWLYSRGGASQDRVQSWVTTFSSVIFKSTTAYLFHAGDSRVYRLRRGVLEQLTRDHRVWVSREKNYLSRALGIDLHLEVDYRALAVEPGDCFVMTTDGVHDFVDDATLLRLCSGSEELHTAAGRIVNAALERGGEDNATCQIVRVESLPSQEPEEVYRRLTELPFPPALEPGMVLDGYRVLEERHASKRTQVYLVEDTATGARAIMKTPSVNFEDDPAYIDRFLLEEWAARRIRNPHVVRAVDPDRRKQFLYYLVEHVEGKTLRKWIEDHPQPEVSVVRDLVRQIARGLQAFHRLDMVHRDLKPDNIMIDTAGAIRIIDFGSVRIEGIEEIELPVEREQLLGTENYTAPECVLGNPGMPASDVFSLGTIAYEMLTGKLPYGEHLAQRLDPRRLRRLKYALSTHTNPLVPAWIDGALRKAVHPDPRLRYETLSEFVYDLDHPNPRFLETHTLPLAERNPAGFWKVVAGLLLLLNLVLLYFLAR